MVKHWSEKISLDVGEIYLRWLLHGEKFASEETETLVKIFSDMDVYSGDKVLDLCCGYGRHAIRLGKKGFRVTGVDLSEANINYAKTLMKEKALENQVNFMVGDVREIAKILKSEEGTFKATISILPAIGYYDQKTDEDILRQIHQLTAPKGVLVIDLANRDYHMEAPKFTISRIKGSPPFEIHHFYGFDYENSRRNETWKIYRVNGENLEHLSMIKIDRRLYALHELIDLFRRTGWTYIRSFGNYQMEPVKVDKPRIIIIGKKEG